MTITIIAVLISIAIAALLTPHVSKAVDKIIFCLIDKYHVWQIRKREPTTKNRGADL